MSGGSPKAKIRCASRNSRRHSLVERVLVVSIDTRPIVLRNQIDNMMADNITSANSKKVKKLQLSILKMENMKKRKKPI